MAPRPTHPLAAAVPGVLPGGKLLGGANDGDGFGVVLPPPRQLLHRRHPHSAVLVGACAVLQQGQSLGVVRGNTWARS